MEHAEFVKAYNAGLVSLKVDRGKAKRWQHSKIAPRRYYYAFWLWQLVWFAMPLGAAYFFFIGHWIWGLVVVAAFLATPKAQGDTATQNVLEYALDDEKFYYEALIVGLMEITDSKKGGDAERIVNDYGGALLQVSGTGLLYDVALLPHSKEQIKQAILTMLAGTTDKDLNEQLKVGYMWLANFVPNLPKVQQRMELKENPTNDEIEQLAQQVHQDFGTLMPYQEQARAEREVLMQDLRDRGYW